MDFHLLRQLNQTRRDRQAAILITDTTNSDTRLVRERDGYGDDPLAEELAAGFRSGRSGFVAAPERGHMFLTVSVPPPRLVVIGAVHISQALAPMAKLAGFDTTIIDPRTAFATADRFPDVSLVAEWPDDAIREIGLDPFTALAALTHDPKIDDSAIAAALGADSFYVGALGSRKTHGKRLERLRAIGLDERTLAKIHAPIGLAIGAQSPAEIAVAILGEVIAALRHRGARVAEAAA